MFCRKAVHRHRRQIKLNSAVTTTKKIYVVSQFVEIRAPIDFHSRLISLRVDGSRNWNMSEKQAQGCCCRAACATHCNGQYQGNSLFSLFWCEKHFTLRNIVVLDSLIENAQSENSSHFFPHSSASLKHSTQFTRLQCGAELTNHRLHKLSMRLNLIKIVFKRKQV